jgi:hypothetical protein
MVELRIKDILKEKGLTSKALSEKLGKAPQYINNIINGGKGVSLNTLNDIAEELKVPFSSLFADYASLEGVASSGDFVALIKEGKNIYHAESWQELKSLIEKKEVL